MRRILTTTIVLFSIYPRLSYSQSDPEICSGLLSKLRGEIEAKQVELSEGIQSNSLYSWEISARTKELSGKIAKLLESQGYKTKVFLNHAGWQNSRSSWLNSWMISITDSPKGAVQGASDKLGASYLFSPAFQASHPNVLGGQLGGTKAVILPIESVVDDTVGMNVFFLHETSHLKLQTDLVDGKPRPYYARASSEGPAPVTPVPGYSHALSMEELFTFSRSLSQLKAHVADVTPFGEKNPGYAQRIEATASMLSAISKETKRLVQNSRDAIDAGKVRFFTDPKNSRVAAEVPLVSKNARIGKMTYWLVDAKSQFRTAENTEILKSYLNDVENAADAHLQEANEVLQR